MMYLLLVIPVVLAYLKQVKYKGYFLSPVITLFCLMIAVLSPREGKFAIASAYAFSIAGDYFLAHKEISPFSYLFGVGGFFVAHAFFLVYAAMKAEFSYAGIILAALLLIPYAPFLLKGLYPNIREIPMRFAVTLYMLISVSVISVSAMMAVPPMEKWVFMLGIAMILFSDTLIALDDFMGRRRYGFLILPTYYACHILIASSMIL